MELNKLHLMDCMEGMAQFPDGYFSLAITDPPYGIGKMDRKERQVDMEGGRGILRRIGIMSHLEQNILKNCLGCRRIK